jgi:NADH dehydrogenase
LQGVPEDAPPPSPHRNGWQTLRNTGALTAHPAPSACEKLLLNNAVQKQDMKANIRINELTRVVIVGCSLGGLKLAMSLRHSGYQVVVVDKNNYNQFPPLIYQVASAGLEPSNISFPLRRIFQGYKHYFFRMADVKTIDTEEKAIRTSVGTIHYNYLVLAMGGTTNFFGNTEIMSHALPMKTVEDAMALRNHILLTLERAETEEKAERRQKYMNFVIVGGGPSGVEIAGALAEMKKDIVPKDYPDLADRMHIYLINASDRLLAAMDPKSSATAEKDLKRMGVHIRNGWRVTGYNGHVVTIDNGTTIESATVIWVSGIRANAIDGIPEEALGHGGRLLCDRFNRVKGMEDVFAVGDQCLIEGDPEWPMGHRQLAQAAMQQAANVAANIVRKEQNKAMVPFRYRNLGTMATIGRRHAVAEIGKARFGGFTAWVLWLVVHLRSILGVKNKFFVLFNWMWNYFNYKQSLRLILRPRREEDQQ